MSQVKKLITIQGLTKSGKSTVAEYLNSLDPQLKPFDCIEPLRDMYTLCFGLPTGCLTKQEHKNQLIPGTNHTYQDQMVSDFEYYSGKGLALAANWVYNGTKEYTKVWSVPVFQNIRNPNEVDSLIKLVQEGYDLYTIAVTRPNSESLSSDRYLTENTRRLVRWSRAYYPVFNNSDLANLYSKLDRIYGDITQP